MASTQKPKNVTARGDSDVLAKILDLLDGDKQKGETGSCLPGSFQLLEVSDGLMSFYNATSINMYLAWNQEHPLIIDVTTLRTKTWKRISKW